MKILIKNGILVSMNCELDKVVNGIDILVEDDKIVKIDKNIEVNGNEKIIDASGKVVMPGLINTHAHVPMSIFRETLDGYELQEWLSEKIWPMEDKLTKEDIYYASCMSFIEMIKTGTTTINDLYFMTDEIIRAMNDTGIRLQTTRTLMDIDGDINGEDRINELEELIKKYKDVFKKLTFNVGIHGLYTSSGEYVKRCIDLAKKYNFLIHMHFCENSKEVLDIEKLHNDMPINIIKNMFTNMPLILAHCVKLTSEEINILSDMNVSVSHCPISNLKLGCGISNIELMLEKGINVSLGTDGQGSGSNLDLFEVMKYTALLQKGINENPKVLSSYEVLKMATINGARALGLDDRTGSIEVGKQADIIIIDVDNITTRPVNDLISQIVYNVKGSNVLTTIIDGNILMENKKLLFDREKEIINRCEKIINRINND